MPKETNDSAYLLHLPSSLLASFTQLAKDNERSTAGELRILMKKALANRVANTLGDD